MALTIRVERSLASVSSAAWDALDHGGSPFLEYGFLRALELSGSIGSDSGWDPYYIIASAGDDFGADDALVGAVPCFIKHHSYGEYIFDFGWAKAAQRARIRYYPKLVVAAPATPASGRRMLLRRAARPGPAEVIESDVVDALIAAVFDLADEAGLSSIHWLFCTHAEQELLARRGFLSRSSFQYHWHNRGWSDFDDFLQSLTSRRRKQIRKERARAHAGVDDIEFVWGPDIDPTHMATIDRFYRQTTRLHGGEAYLRPGFFQLLHQVAAPRLAVALARAPGKVVAGALFLHTPDTLFGRYWGCDVQVPMLHFELAYYQGIEQSITRGLQRFEAGAQGEHKLLRGFSATPTYSSHWIREPALRDAVGRFLGEEAGAVNDYLERLQEFEPYRHDPK